MNASQNPHRVYTLCAMLLSLTTMTWCFIAPVSAADIGVLTLGDGRQQSGLNLLDPALAAARLALTDDGHQVVAVTSLSSLVLDNIDILWLSLLASNGQYTLQERIQLVEYAEQGGRIVWIGDAGVFNLGDDSFLNLFGISKLPGNYNTAGPLLAIADHPVVTGPFGSVLTIATEAEFGLMDTTGATTTAAAVFTDNVGPGDLVALLELENGTGNDGRIALVCDASMFGQFPNDDDHRALLRNLVKWLEAPPGYTPSGTPGVTVQLTDGCDACVNVQVQFANVLNTGETAVVSGGAGRCGFSGIAPEKVPADFLGFGFVLSTTAVLPSPTSLTITIAYDSAALANLGITDEDALQIYRFNSDTSVMVTLPTTVDLIDKTVTADSAGVGSFLFGVSSPAQDCNANSIADVCEIDENSTAPGGPYFCTQNCDPDCNDDGIPDACQLTANDCNGNGVPDECDAAVAIFIGTDPAAGGSAVAQSAGPYPVCSSVSIEATPAEGHCFSGWTVDTGAPPADAGAQQTTIEADEDKTVTAHFIEIIIQQPVDLDLCAGDAATLSVQVHADLAAGAAFQWQKDGQAIAAGNGVSGTASATLIIDPVAAGHAGNYACIVSHACGTATSDDAVMSVAQNASINTHPQNQSTCPGDTVHFNVVASGAGLAFQWQYDDGSGFGDLADLAGVNGSTTATLELTDISIATAGLYQCLVTGTCGTPVASAAATLTVGQGPLVIDNPTSRTACPGDDVAFTVFATGTALAFQWWFDDGNGIAALTDDAGIAGVTTNTLNLTSIAAGAAGLYSCSVTGECGLRIWSAPAVLTVGMDVQIVSNPADQSACPGDSAIFTSVATGTNVTYQWQFNSGTGFTDLNDVVDTNGTTTSTLSLANLSPDKSGSYRCVASADCGIPLASDSANLVIQPIVVISSHPADVSTCAGHNVLFQVAAGGEGLAYQWQFNGGSAFENLADGARFSGALTDTLSISGAAAGDQGIYQCVVTGACGPAQTSDTPQLTISSGECDCDGNGISDGEDIIAGTAIDCNGNGILDSCDLDEGSDTDCNSNGVPDGCDIAEGASLDCNSNGLPDECELADDCNGDGIPDICQLPGNDCNVNGVLDECDPPYAADAGPDILICSTQISLPMGGPIVATGSLPPYTYDWRIISGPPQGAEIISSNGERGRFLAGLPGSYEIELEVSDSSSPPCVVADTLVATVYEMSVGMGEQFTMCANATSEPLPSTVIGGTEPYLYEWAILSGSPSTDPAQFSGGGSNSAAPTFTPDLSGVYSLQLIVTDANAPGCVVSDTMTINAKRLVIAVPGDFAMCAAGESAPIDAILTSPGTPPYSYEWSIAAGSPNTALSQFGGNGSTTPSPTFLPTSLGQYILRVEVHDSSTPPCEHSAALSVTVGSLTVDAGEGVTQCVGAGGILLAPSVQGGVGTLVYSWTIDSGSPSVDPGQFTNPHSFDETPLFIPAALGSYTLRLTVIDDGTPPCVASDTVLIRATSMSVDAGEDFVTQAFQASRPLGALPIVAGGDAPFDYEWTILAGPSAGASQLSDPKAERPLFMPAAVGTYALELRVTDANGAGCLVTDRVTIEAIAASQTLKVNSEGRLFMPLQIDAPYTSGELRIAGADPGADVTGELYDDGASANFAGLSPMPRLSRRLFLQSELPPGSYVAVVIMQYGATEVSSDEEGAIQLHWFDGRAGVWSPAATGPAEDGPYPARPTQADVGRRGVDRSRKAVWAVVDYMGEFSIGISSNSTPTAPDQTAPQDPAGLSTPMCGTFGAATLLPLLAIRLRRTKRRRIIRSCANLPEPLLPPLKRGD